MARRPTSPARGSPIRSGQIWSAAMMLEHLGESEAAAAIVKAIEQALAEAKTRTRDLGGTADTVAAGKAVAAAPGLMAKPVALTKAQARRIWLRAQRLDEAAPFGGGPEATRAAVEHLGYVQIDTINVVERCHHQILYTRIPGYRRDHLRQAQSVDKTVFEYWTHALSYVPTADMRFLRPRHEAGVAPAQRLVHVGEARRPAQGAGPHPPQGRPSDDPRHRRRRAGGEGPRMGEPQAVKARAAARLLSRRADGEPARGHAEDLRADDPPLRLGPAAEGGLGARDPELSARPRAAVAGDRQPRFDLPPRCSAQGRDLPD